MSPNSAERRESRELASVVDDFANDAADVAMALGVVEAAELGGGLVQACVGRCIQESVASPR